MADRPKSAGDVMKIMKDKDVKFFDLRFTDTKGKMQHVTADASCVDEAMFADGYAFDGSSIAGWKGIEASDMTLMPDPASAHIDPFFAQTTMAIFCDVLEPSTGEMYERDPRSIAKRAEAYMKQTGIGDSIVFGPEAEFFIFDDVKFSSDPYNCGFKLDGTELPTNMGTDYEMGNLGHRPRTKGGYFPVPPIDSGQDIRSEMLSVMAEMGVVVEKHHHEVASAQHELGIKFGPMVTMADHLQIYKYVIHQVAQAYGKTATFMPKPVYGDNGSGMHCHQSIWKGSTPVFAGNKYADLSETCLFYIGGILKHAKTINAFTNPSTNSYKRLVPGYEAPVLLAYSARNRSASCRIPVVSSPKAKHRDPLPRSVGEPLSRVCRHADGRPRWHPEQDPSGRRHRQEPLRSAAGRAVQNSDRLRIAARGAQQPRRQSGVPEEGRRDDRRHDRRLHRAQDGRSGAHRHDAASGRVRHVLLGLVAAAGGHERQGRGGFGRPFL
jgi:glutamine synthetase